MSWWADLFSGSLLALAACASVMLVRSSWQQLGLLFRALGARRVGFDKVLPGPVTLRGRVAAIDELAAEESGNRGVYLAYSVDRWERSSTLGGLSGHWVRAEADEEAAPFELTDGEHRVLVDPERAQVFAGQSVSQLIRPDGSVVRYREALIETGAEVVVLGRASEAGGFDPSTAYRGHSFRVVVSAGPPGNRFYLGTRRQIVGTFLLGAASRVFASVATLALVVASLAALIR